MRRYLAAIVGPTALLAAVLAQPPQTAPPPFELVQPDLFAAPGGQPSRRADVDGDGDLDLALTNNNPTGAHPL